VDAKQAGHVKQATEHNSTTTTWRCGRFFTMQGRDVEYMGSAGRLQQLTLGEPSGLPAMGLVPRGLSLWLLGWDCTLRRPHPPVRPPSPLCGSCQAQEQAECVLSWCALYRGPKHDPDLDPARQFACIMTADV